MDGGGHRVAMIRTVGRWTVGEIARSAAGRTLQPRHGQESVVECEGRGRQRLSVRAGIIIVVVFFLSREVKDQHQHLGLSEVESPNDAIRQPCTTHSGGFCETTCEKPTTDGESYGQLLRPF